MENVPLISTCLPLLAACRYTAFTTSNTCVILPRTHVETSSVSFHTLDVSTSASADMITSEKSSLITLKLNWHPAILSVLFSIAIINPSVRKWIIKKLHSQGNAVHVIITDLQLTQSCTSPR